MVENAGGTGPRARHSYSEERGLLAYVFELLEQVFPGIGTTAERARAMGASWESVSHPYVHSEDGRAVVHVGVIELRLLLEGELCTVGTVHAVATHPEWRRRGLFRRLMDTVLEDCGSRYRALILTTENPEYYEPFGFRVVPEHEFRIRLPRGPLDADPGPAMRAEGPPGMRPLDLSRAADLDTLHRLLERREPVSAVCGVAREKAVFCFNEGRGPLWYAEDLDALCVYRWEHPRLDLYDVVAPRMPSLYEVLDRVPERPRPEEVVVHFCPDRLGVGFVAANAISGHSAGAEHDRAAKIAVVERRFDHDGPSCLMVRGELIAPHLPFTLPRSART